jgi:hypothetical protein
VAETLADLHVILKSWPATKLENLIGRETKKFCSDHRDVHKHDRSFRILSFSMAFTLVFYLLVYWPRWQLKRALVPGLSLGLPCIHIMCEIACYYVLFSFIQLMMHNFDKVILVFQQIVVLRNPQQQEVFFV